MTSCVALPTKKVLSTNFSKTSQGLVLGDLESGRSPDIVIEISPKFRSDPWIQIFANS